MLRTPWRARYLRWVSLVGDVWSPSFISTDDGDGEDVSADAKLVPRARALTVLEERNCLRFMAVPRCSCCSGLEAHGDRSQPARSANHPQAGQGELPG